RGRRRLVVGEAATKRSGRVGVDAVARAAEQLPQRLVQRLALDVPQRNVDRRLRKRVYTGATGVTGRGAQFAQDRLDALRIVADGQGAEFIDRSAQRAGHGAAVERKANAFDALVRLDAKYDDGAQPARLLRHVRQRIVLGYAQDIGLYSGDLHTISSAGAAS